MRATIIAGLMLASATPALAQSDNQGENDDTFTIGAGGASVPRFEGADDNRIIPFGVIRGSVSGISFTTQGTGLYVDLIPRETPTGGKLLLGPVIKVNLNRTDLDSIDDVDIEQLGELDTAIELGGQIGYSQNGVITSDFDNLTISVAGTYDVGGAYKGYVVTPQISYGTPLSTSTYVGISASAAYVGGDYADYYFDVNPAQAALSGLPGFDADDGFKSITFGGIGAISLSGDLRNGLSLFAIGSYSKLLGDFKRSPVSRSNDQWFGGLGVAYTF